MYVHWRDWDAITNPEDPRFWEEVFHGVQFTAEGGGTSWYSHFYQDYAGASIHAWLSGGDTYKDNDFEAFAQHWSGDVAAAYVHAGSPCRQ